MSNHTCISYFFSGLRWPLLAFVGLCGPALACMAFRSQLVCRKKKKKKKHTYVTSQALCTLPCPHRPALALVDLCWPALGLCGSLWVFVGLHLPAWPCIASQYVEKKRKKGKNIPTLHLEPYALFHALVGLHWLLLAAVGLHWPSLTFIGLHWAFVGLCGSLWVFVGLHWPALACMALRSQLVCRKKKKEKKEKTYLCRVSSPTHPSMPLQACIGSHWLLWALIDLCWPALGLHGSSWACIGLHGLSQLVTMQKRKKKKKKTYLPLHLEPYAPFHALLGLRWPLFGWHWPALAAAV